MYLEKVDMNCYERKYKTRFLCIGGGKLLSFSVLV